PERAAAGPRQQRPVRSDREREEGRDQQEEDERQRRGAAGQSETEFAQDQAPHASVTDWASGKASGWWVATRTAPPSARCVSIAASSAARPSASRPLPGSSSSQSGACAAITRARIARLRWPVESMR